MVFFENFGQAQVKAGIIDEDGAGRSAANDLLLQMAKNTAQKRQVAHHFAKSHYGHTPGVIKLLLPQGVQVFTADTEKLHVRFFSQQLAGDTGSVQITGGLSGNDQDRGMLVHVM